MAALFQLEVANSGALGVDVAPEDVENDDRVDVGFVVGEDITILWILYSFRPIFNVDVGFQRDANV